MVQGARGGVAESCTWLRSLLCRLNQEEDLEFTRNQEHVAKKPITIGRWTFNSQAAAITHIQEVLYRRPLLTLIDGDDREFVQALLSKHAHAAEKIGIGVKYFTVEKAKGGTQCFYITRLDGSRSDFSYMNCLRGRD
jgi:hypothetical protein